MKKMLMALAIPLSTLSILAAPEASILIILSSLAGRALAKDDSPPCPPILCTPGLEKIICRKPYINHDAITISKITFTPLSGDSLSIEAMPNSEVSYQNNATTIFWRTPKNRPMLDDPNMTLKINCFSEKNSTENLLITMDYYISSVETGKKFVTNETIMQQKDKECILAEKQTLEMSKALLLSLGLISLLYGGLYLKIVINECYEKYKNSSLLTPLHNISEEDIELNDITTRPLNGV